MHMTLKVCSTILGKLWGPALRKPYDRPERSSDWFLAVAEWEYRATSSLIMTKESEGQRRVDREAEVRSRVKREIASFLTMEGKTLQKSAGN